jgi:hypothetical protein
VLVAMVFMFKQQADGTKEINRLLFQELQQRR